MPYIIETRRKEAHCPWEFAYDFAYATDGPANEDVTYCRFKAGKKLEFRARRVDDWAGELRMSFRTSEKNAFRAQIRDIPPQMEVVSISESLTASPDAIASLIDREAIRGRRVRR